MISIWRSVAEDFAVFDVDVTTEDPGGEALRRVDEDDTAYGIRIVIGGRCSDWLGGGCGGIAYLRSFDWNR
jgi:hypothetical protein